MEYADAVARYFEDCEGKGTGVVQPDESESACDQWGWILRNINGPIAYVTDAGEVLPPEGGE